jgi:protein tyrosine/serine phosphatase
MKLIICIVIQCVFLTTETRPDKWAKPLQVNGADNLFQVNDFIYRSRQPTKEGFANLNKLGIRKVINLRNFWTDKNELKGSGITDFCQVKVNAGKIEDDEVITVLRILKDTAAGPFLMHCQHGADRTGVMCAMYRIVFQGWSREAALEELREGGYGFHGVWRNIPEYIKSVDIDYIRKEVMKS